MTGDNRYCILSLDGGGTWALIQARALLKIYGNIPGRELLNKFQLVAATSGGSIVLAGLIENMMLKDIVDAFENESWRRTIFVDLPWYEKFGRIFGLGPRFSTEEKFSGLRRHFPTTVDVTLSQIPAKVAQPPARSPDFLITAFNYDRERMMLFRSNKSSLASSASPSPDVTLGQAVHASTNAPINFFDVPAEFQNPRRRFWDGSVSGNNNPVLVAMIEALANGVAKETIRVLSIGTGNIFLPLKDPVNNPLNVGSPLVNPIEQQGLIHDIKKVATSILDDPPDAATFIAHVALVGKTPRQSGGAIGNSPVVRMNPLVQPVLRDPNYPPGQMEWMLPGWNAPQTDERLKIDEFKRLLELDIAIVEKKDVDIIVKFCKEWLGDIVTNQAIRARSDNFACEIGHDKFSKALEAWSSCGC